MSEGERFEKALEGARRQGVRFAICQFIAAMLAPEGADHDDWNEDAPNVVEFWDWYDALDEPPMKGPCYAAGLWVKAKLRGD